MKNHTLYTLKRTQMFLRMLFTGTLSMRVPRGGRDHHQNDPCIDRQLVLLKWLNKNQYLLRLLRTSEKLAFKVSHNEHTILVSAYVILDEDQVSVEPEGVLVTGPGSDEGFWYHQKEWEDAIGGEYTPYLFPIRECGPAVYCRPLFTINAPIEGRWTELLYI